MKNFSLFIAIAASILISCTPTYIVTFSGSTGGTVSDIGGEYDEGTVVSVTAIPNAEYEFVSWSNGSNQNPLSITVSETTSYTASFKKVEYEVTTNVIGQGTIKEEVLIQGGRYTSGTKLRLTAIPQEGWEFDTWSGSVISTLNPIELDVNAAKDIVANFSKLPSIYLDENGVTIKAQDWALIGDSEIINGVEYKVVDRTTLFQMIKNGDDVTKVCTTKITDLSREFSETNYPETFNQDIRSWDVSNVKSMRWLFLNTSFNQPIGKWDVSNVEDMFGMFRNSKFNQDISDWNVSKVTNLATMFSYSDFNQNISDWDVSNLTEAHRMFASSLFNQDIGEWDVGNVWHMEGMFADTPFNQDISEWDVSNVKRMTGMFHSTPFNQDIGEWDVGNVIDMGGMFYGTPFNKELNNWDTKNVTNMEVMFYNSQFDRDLGNWDVSNVTNMRSMFAQTPFNHDISGWNVSKVISMKGMFDGAKNFNQDLNSWDTSNVADCTNFSVNTPQWNQPKPNFTNCNPN